MDISRVFGGPLFSLKLCYLICLCR